MARRGAEIIEVRGSSSIASAAHASIEHVRSDVLGGFRTSAAVVSHGEYGVPEGLICSFPVTSDGSGYRVVADLGVDDRSRKLIDASVDEPRRRARRRAEPGHPAVIEVIVIATVTVLVIAGATALGPRLRLAGPLLLVLLGLGVSLLPFVPPFELDPEVILVGVLPPLLYSAAVSLPAIEFRRDVRPISGLAVLLVVVSAVALGFFFHAVIPGLDLYLAIALGAILSPTDAVATSIAKRLGISRRVTTWLDGESLLNDATSLVILRTMVAAAVTGSIPEGGIVGAFLWGVVVAIVVGSIIGYINLRVRALVRNPAANTAIGFVVPFVAYLPTEALGGSGLVAAVVAGIVTGQGAARRFTPEQRLSDEPELAHGRFRPRGCGVPGDGARGEGPLGLRLRRRRGRSRAGGLPRCDGAADHPRRAGGLRLRPRLGRVSARETRGHPPPTGAHLA